MNKRQIISFIGKIIIIEAALMVLPLLVALYYGDGDARAFGTTILAALVVGGLMSRVRAKDSRLSSREGYFIVATAWIIISLIGAMPLYLSGSFRSYASALFEMVAGFSTTGATVLEKPEVLGHGLLFWRSFSQWIGGMGVLVFVLMVMPMQNDSSMHLVRAEVPGPTAGKLVPRMQTTTRILYSIYTGMTVILFFLLQIGEMPVFDSVCIAFATTGTGGFAVHSGGYGSAYIDTVVGIFMLLCGINFNLFHFLFLGKVKDIFRSEETKVYLGIIAIATAAISINMFSSFAALVPTVKTSLFHVISIITTTGFVTEDFNLWPEFSKHTLLLLMMIGACSGSTGGGLKVSRAILLFKSVIGEIRHIITPKAIHPVRLNGKPVDHEVLFSTKIYASAYLLLICLFTWVLSLDGQDLTTNLTAVIACFNNIGIGLGGVGPMSNYALYSDWAQVLLSIAMLTGRLEIFPMFLLFAKSAHARK